MTLGKIHNFLNKHLNKSVLLIGKNNFKRKFIINCILKYCKNERDCVIYSGFKLKCIKFIFDKKKNIKISFIIEKIIGLSKFSKNKTVIIFYQICNINKSRQTYLLKEINKIKKNFFFIFTSSDIKKISFAIKKSVFVLPLDGLNFFLKKKKDCTLKFKHMVKKNVKPVYQYTWFLSTILSYKNFILYDKLLTSFSIKNFSYIDIFEILKVAKLVTYSKNLDIFINFQVLFLKNNFCFIWDMLKNLVLKFCYRTN